MTNPTNATCPPTVRQPILRARRRARSILEGDSSKSTCRAARPSRWALSACTTAAVAGLRSPSRTTTPGGSARTVTTRSHRFLNQVDLVLEREPGFRRFPTTLTELRVGGTPAVQRAEAVCQGDGIIRGNEVAGQPAREHLGRTAD